MGKFTKQVGIIFILAALFTNSAHAADVDRFTTAEKLAALRGLAIGFGQLPRGSLNFSFNNSAYAYPVLTLQRRGEADVPIQWVQLATEAQLAALDDGAVDNYSGFAFRLIRSLIESGGTDSIDDIFEIIRSATRTPANSLRLKMMTSESLPGLFFRAFAKTRSVNALRLFAWSLTPGTLTHRRFFAESEFDLVTPVAELASDKLKLDYLMTVLSVAFDGQPSPNRLTAPAILQRAERLAQLVALLAALIEVRADGRWSALDWSRRAILRDISPRLRAEVDIYMSIISDIRYTRRSSRIESAFAVDPYNVLQAHDILRAQATLENAIITSPLWVTHLALLAPFQFSVVPGSHIETNSAPVCGDFVIAN